MNTARILRLVVSSLCIIIGLCILAFAVPIGYGIRHGLLDCLEPLMLGLTSIAVGSLEFLYKRPSPHAP